MHGSPWLRASEATRVRRRQINGLGRAIGVLIGVLEFALGKIGVVGVAYVDRQRLAQNSSTVLPPFNMHNLAHYPTEVLNRAARIFGVGGYMLGERLLLRPDQVVAPIEVINRLASDILRIAGHHLGERLLPALAFA